LFDGVQRAKDYYNKAKKDMSENLLKALQVYEDAEKAFEEALSTGKEDVIKEALSKRNEAF